MRQLVAQMDSQVKKLDSATWLLYLSYPLQHTQTSLLDLPRGAKWMIRAADTPSLRNTNSTRTGRCWDLLLFVFGFILAEVIQCFVFFYQGRILYVTTIDILQPLEVWVDLRYVLVGLQKWHLKRRYLGKEKSVISPNLWWAFGGNEINTNFTAVFV